MGNAHERDFANQKHKSVCVDFDGCIAFYEKWEGALQLGDPLPGAKEFMQALKEEGFEIILYTCRASGEFEFPRWGYPGEGTGKHLANELEVTDALAAWMDEHDMPFDRIWTGKYKPHADAYVDDRAVSCAPQKVGSAAYSLAFQKCLGLAKVDARTAHHKALQLEDRLPQSTGQSQPQPLRSIQPANDVLGVGGD